MQYHNSHQHWQLYVFNPLKNTLVRFLCLRFILALNYLALSRLSHQLFLTSKFLVIVALIPLLLVYSVNSQALTASTAQVINGSEPYITFDNGVTKVTQAEGLLGITLTDGTNITPEKNTSTIINPIVLPDEIKSFVDIVMLVPSTTDSIALNDLIGGPNNYWGDDDGDGQGAGGITATGRLIVSIVDKKNKKVSRNAVLNICQAPYKLVLSITEGSLITQYGVPNSRNFIGSATYYITPKIDTVICSVRPTLQRDDEIYAGLPTMWDVNRGFLVQSTNPSSYNRNFPTTGANNLYFDLVVGGNVPLIWPTVTHGGITATMTLNPPRDLSFNPDGYSTVRVTLTGPTATESQINSSLPGSINKPTLPQTFELVGYDSNNNAIVKYGFVLKQWFISRGDIFESVANHSLWCSSLGDGYRMPHVKDLTNAVCNSEATDQRYNCRGSEGATPASIGNHYQRNIGAGFFSEWGLLEDYGLGYSLDYHWISDHKEGTSYNFFVNMSYGTISAWFSNHRARGICVYP